MYTCMHAPSPSTPRTHFDTHLTHSPLWRQLSALVNHWQFSCHQLRPRVGSTLKQAPSTHTRRKRALQWLYHTHTHTHTSIRDTNFTLRTECTYIRNMYAYHHEKHNNLKKHNQQLHCTYIHIHMYVSDEGICRMSKHLNNSFTLASLQQHMHMYVCTIGKQ